MADLTTKELDALTDQLNYERMMACKYDAARKSCVDASICGIYNQYASQHRQNYTDLLNYLK